VGNASSYPAPRARPVADLPLEQLTDTADELSRAWAVALILARAPSAIAEVPLEELARDGPRMCEQVLRALQSDAELERLTQTHVDGGHEEPVPATRLGSLAGASDVPSVVAAMESLRGVLWEALLAAVRRPAFDRADAHLLADLADRLAYVCSMVLAASLPAVVARPQQMRGPDEVLVAGSGGAPPPRGEPVASAGPGGHGEVVIVDERQHAESSPRVVARGARSAGYGEEDDSAPAWSPPPPVDPPPARQPPVAEVAFPPSVSVAAPPRERTDSEADRRSQPAAPGAPGEIQIRDERSEEGPAAWIRSIGRELERFALEGRPFAVLLVELMDAQRLNRSEPQEEVMRLAGQVHRTLESELWTMSERAGASLTREAPGRFWLVAPGIEALRVRALAEQIAHAVRRSVSHRGEPLEIAIGTAVCPGDGVQAAALAAHADVALYAARADGSAGDGAAR
jgi:GGDEF domain-containing protein